MPDTGRRFAEAGLRLFLEQGFDATSMRDLASAVGTAPGAFYRYYASKDALLLELTTPLTDALVALAAELSARAGTDDDADDDEILRRYTEVLHAHRSLVLFAMTDPAYARHPSLGQRARAAAAEIAALLARRHGDLLAGCAFGAVLGGVTAAASGGDEGTAEGIVAFARRVLGD